MHFWSGSCWSTKEIFRINDSHHSILSKNKGFNKDFFSVTWCLQQISFHYFFLNCENNSKTYLIPKREDLYHSGQLALFCVRSCGQWEHSIVWKEDFFGDMLILMQYIRTALCLLQQPVLGQPLWACPFLSLYICLCKALAVSPCLCKQISCTYWKSPASKNGCKYSNKNTEFIGGIIYFSVLW